ncbi:hypothetical protein [Microbacterium sp. NPDC087665]|uniref:hypothetical protein n=1 Tax=Microbacterium sp. NPDC087665 TaxID=3364194 RepID=UPI00381408D9
MSAMKSVFRELRQAVLDGMAHSKDKLHQLADNLTDHLDNVIRQIKDKDKFDADGVTRPKPLTHPYVPSTSRKPPGMSDQDYFDILNSSVHNPNGLEVVLGKFRVPGTPSYIDVAEGKMPPGTYFSLGDRWDDIADAHHLDDDGMFGAFNVPFLERVIAEGKPIGFSHNPQDFPGTALADELDFLEDHGYRFDPTTMQAIRR